MLILPALVLILLKYPRRHTAPSILTIPMEVTSLGIYTLLS